MWFIKITLSPALQAGKVLLSQSDCISRKIERFSQIKPNWRKVAHIVDQILTLAIQRDK